MGRKREMLATAPQKSLKAPDLLKSRQVLLGLTVGQILIYLTLLIPLPLYTRFDFVLYSVAIIAGYNILEVSLFFGCQKYNWPCTLTFRIVFAIHDFAYFITYAVFAADYYGYYYYDKEENKLICDYWKQDYCPELLDEYPDEIKNCRYYYECSGPFTLASCIIFVLAFANGVAILCIYSKFPKYGACCQPQVLVKVMTTDGQLVQTCTVATPGSIMQSNAVQNSNQVTGQTNPAVAVTEQSQMAMQTAEIQSS